MGTWEIFPRESCPLLRVGAVVMDFASLYAAAVIDRDEFRHRCLTVAYTNMKMKVVICRLKLAILLYEASHCVTSFILSILLLFFQWGS
ncbi:hypothetical protein NC652_014175 [Populus alba x Populus x berolinensis]|nr:hypothetical protein NC652_014175 [Populus alba x Populus x berolinensis]